MSTPASRTKPLVPVMLISLASVLAFWVVTQALGGLPSGSREEQDRAEVRLKNLEELRAANEQTLENYGWVDKEKGVVRVPIAVAMKTVLPELNARKPAPAYPIATPAPAAPAAATPEAAAQPPSAQPANP